MSQRFALVLALVLSLPVLGAQDAPVIDPVVARIIKTGREDNRVMAHLDHLVNKIGPRLTGSDNLTKACEWARDQFASWGLKARTEEWGTYPVGYNRHGWSGRMLAPEKKELLFGFNAWTPGTEGPVAARAVLAPTTGEELAASAGKLKGAWVVSEGKATKGELALKIRKAYDDEKIAGCIRSSSSDLILTGGQVPVSNDKLPTRVNITLHFKAHKEIVALLKEGKEVRLEFDLKNEFKKGPIPLCNVIADIPGTEKPDEYVIVGGHIDSWDGATGTTDNGTGTVTTMEAARLLMAAGAKPKRTIRFMLWSAEEQGLLGSKAYVRQHPELMPKISAVLVHDGGTNYVSGIHVTAAMLSDAKKVFAPLLDLDPAMPFVITETKGLTKIGGSDHVAFRAEGVPGFFWKQDGRQVYDHEHHTQYDTYDAAIAEYERHTAMVAAIGAWGVANLDHLLPREGMEEVGDEKPRRRLGAQMVEGLKVESVEEGSPAEKGGILEGDQIVSVNGAPVKTFADLKEAIRTPASPIAIGVKRGGKDVVVNVTFPDRGNARRQLLGVQLGGEEGLEVIEVQPNSAALKAGMEVGDEILKVGGSVIATGAELRPALDQAGKKVSVTVRRKGKEKVLELDFGS